MNDKGRELMAREVLEQVLENWNEEPPAGLQQRVLARIERCLANRGRLHTALLSAAACATMLILALPLDQESVSRGQPAFAPDIAQQIPKLRIAPTEPISLITSLPSLRRQPDELPAPHAQVLLRKVVETYFPADLSSLNSSSFRFERFEEDHDSVSVADFGIEPLGIQPATVAPLRVALEQEEEEESTWISGL